MLTYQSLKTSLIRKAALTKTPILGEFELTSLCNFNCPMCYVKSLGKNHDLSTDYWKTVFNEAVNEGLLYALLTGGEPFLRPDFTELYNYLYDLGVKITVFSNGSLLNEAIVMAFVKRPPEMVGLTLYGYDQVSYQLMTGHALGFEQFDQAIDLLKKHQITFALRTIPVKLIYQELNQFIAYAKKKEVFLGYQLYVGPKRHHLSSNHDLRISAMELNDFEKRMKEAFPVNQVSKQNYDTTYSTCPALKSAFFMTCEGYIQPCALVDKPRRLYREGQLNQLFFELNTEMTAKDSCTDCFSCELYSDCMQCYARRTLEGGSNHCAKYLKEIAILKKRDRNG